MTSGQFGYNMITRADANIYGQSFSPIAPTIAFYLNPPAPVNTWATTNAGDVVFPLVDITPYYNQADANHEVYTNKVIAAGPPTVLTPNGGVMWVEGDLRIQAGATAILTGCFVATGNIIVEEHVVTLIHNKVGQLPAFMSRQGNIEIKPDMWVINGLIYARSGDVTLWRVSPMSVFNGQVWCSGDFTGRGVEWYDLRGLQAGASGWRTAAGSDDRHDGLPPLVALSPSGVSDYLAHAGDVPLRPVR